MRQRDGSSIAQRGTRRPTLLVVHDGAHIVPAFLVSLLAVSIDLQFTACARVVRAVGIKEMHIPPNPLLASRRRHSLLFFWLVAHRHRHGPEMLHRRCVPV